MSQELVLLVSRNQFQRNRQPQNYRNLEQMDLHAIFKQYKINKKTAITKMLDKKKMTKTSKLFCFRKI